MKYILIYLKYLLYLKIGIYLFYWVGGGVFQQNSRSTSTDGSMVRPPCSAQGLPGLNRELRGIMQVRVQTRSHDKHLKHMPLSLISEEHFGGDRNFESEFWVPIVYDTKLGLYFTLDLIKAREIVSNKVLLASIRAWVGPSKNNTELLGHWWEGP